MIGHLVACYGAADRYLGMLAATLGEPERAEEHFERALELNRRMGARDLGGAHRLRVRPLPARPRRAIASGPTALLGEAAALAERIGMAGLLGQDPRARRRPPPRRRCPTGSLRARRRSSRSSPQGLSNREIGARLSISEHTAANHIRSILRKTELRQSHRGRVLRPPPRARSA